jgi:hypothetical protein
MRFPPSYGWQTLKSTAPTDLVMKPESVHFVNNRNDYIWPCRLRVDRELLRLKLPATAGRGRW